MMTKGLRVVALISGGKDSCYNMIQCVSEGHSIAALANLRPKDKDELDSYMFQTVGHHLINLYAEAMGVPLYRRTLEGGSVEQGADYTINKNDEVEDLYELLKEVKEKEGVNAVSVGAILSDYQRVRVENVCVRLGLTPLAYLWRREQSELLTEMVAAGIDAILIKVAALGLDPHRHLGRTLAQIHPHMLAMKEKFELNVCGEGGEYETFTLDCPLFKKRIVIDKQEMVMHSDDPIAPVGYLNLLDAHLVDKESIEIGDYLKTLQMMRSSDMVTELLATVSDNTTSTDQLNAEFTIDLSKHPDTLTDPPDSYIKFHEEPSGHFWVSGVMGWLREDESIENVTKQAMNALRGQLRVHGKEMSDLVLMQVYVRNMSEYAQINQVYKSYFSINPPARLCIEVPLPDNVGLRICCYGYRPMGAAEGSLHRRTMHVQGLSHWAPANIGPYSQAVMIGETVNVAGLIAMIPANLDLVPGVVAQCRLSLHHVASILAAMTSSASIKLRHVLIGICYVTHPDHIETVRNEYAFALKESLHEEDIEFQTDRALPILEYLVVPTLPKRALVEWQVYASNSNSILSGTLTSVKDNLEAVVHYKYLSSPCNLLSFILTIDSRCSMKDDLSEYHSGLQLAHEVLASVHEEVSQKQELKGERIGCRCAQVFYRRSFVSEDQLRKSFLGLHTVDSRMPMAGFIPVSAFSSEKRLLMICS